MTADSSSSPPRPLSPIPPSPLRHPAFRALWLAAVFSYVGNWVQDVGESWLMLTLTTSPVLVAMVTTSYTIPAFVLVLPAGVLSDRLDRRRLLLFAQGFLVIVAALLATCTWLGMASPGLILVASAGLGIGSALSLPAWQTLIPELVPREAMAEAVTLNSVAFNIARATGPAIGGLVISATHPAAAFTLNALSFLAIIVVLWKYPRIRQASEAPRPSEPHESLGGAMLTAIRYVRASRRLRAIYAAIAAFSAAAASIPALLPLYAKTTLHTSERGYGVLLGALGAGAVMGAVILRRVRPRVGVRPLVVASLLLYGFSSLGMAFAPSLGVATLLMFPAGVGWISGLSTLNALVQMSTPRGMRSRAMAMYQLAHLVAWSAGAGLGGVIASQVGAPITMRLGALATIAATVYIATLRLPALEDRSEAETIAPVREAAAPAE